MTDPTVAAAMAIDRERALRAFAAYVDDYDPSDPKIRLKIDHTYRVAGLCARIAESAGLDAGEVDLAWLCGLLHDIGRFEQVRQYGTFNDALSVAHAALSVEVLFDEGRIRDYVDDDACDPLIRTAVGTHSDFRLPADLDPRTRVLCDVLRDADKVDILKAICESDMASTLNTTDGAIRASELSPEVVAAFKAHRTVRRDDRRHPADFLMGYVCLVFELVYPESLRIAREQGFLPRLFAVPYELPATRAAVADLEADLRSWLAGRGQGDEGPGGEVATA